MRRDGFYRLLSGLVVWFPALLLAATHAMGAGDDLLPVFARAQAGRPLRAVAMGGSITQAGGGWIGPWLRERFPGATGDMHNAGMSGTGSGLGVFRLGRDVIDKQPDLVMIEFAVNDRGGDDADVIRSMESLVVRLKTLPDPPAVVIVNAAERDSPNHARHERVAAHYGLLSINLQRVVDERLKKTGGVWADLMTDDVHPNAKGHALYAEAIAAALEPFVVRAAKGKPSEALSPPLPPPLSKRPLILDGRMIPLAPQPGWSREATVPAWWTRFFPEGFIGASEPGTMLTLNVRATEIGLLYPLDAGHYGPFYVNVDGGQPVMQDAGFRDGYTSVTIGSDLAPAEHLVRVVTARPFDGGVAPVYLGYVLVAGESRATGDRAPQGDVDLRAQAMRLFDPVPAAKWEWCGPFGGAEKTRGGIPTDDFKRAFGPETGPYADWKPVAGDGAFVDFVRLGGWRDRGVCYARTVVKRTAGGTVEAGLRLDYFAKVWINGKLAKTVDGNHGHPMAPVMFPVELHQGDNEVMIKVHAGSNGSGFAVYLNSSVVVPP